MGTCRSKDDPPDQVEKRKQRNKKNRNKQKDSSGSSAEAQCKEPKGHQGHHNDIFVLHLQSRAPASRGIEEEKKAISDNVRGGQFLDYYNVGREIGRFSRLLLTPEET